MTGRRCQVQDLGVLPYRRAWDYQVELAGSVADGRAPDALLLVEHPHVYTRGRLSGDGHVRLPVEELERRGIEVVETDRGGQVTYHGPGQLVVYPVVDLKGWGGPLQYVRTLERVIIGALGDFGVGAGVNPGLTGVWVGGAKIGAIGVKISRGVAHHGFAINVNPDLRYFEDIVPCGIEGLEVTSVERLLGRQVRMAEVGERVAVRFGEEMGFEMVASVEACPLGRNALR